MIINRSKDCLKRKLQRYSFRLVVVAIFIGVQIFTWQALALSQTDDSNIDCVSKDVWDAGFVFRFDVTMCKAGEARTVRSDLYEIITMWTPERIYFGDLKMIRVEGSNARFALVDRVYDPLVAIHFNLENSDPVVEVLTMNGNKPKAYAMLDCDPRLIKELAEACLQ